MSAVSRQGFTTVRSGRGYRPEQVDAAVERLGEERDSAWERAARLTVLQRELEKELEQLSGELAAVGEQTYEELGERAQQILVLALEESADLRRTAQTRLDQARAESERQVAALTADTRQAAAELREEAEARLQSALGAAQQEAAELLASARAAVEDSAGEATAALAEMRRRTAAMVADTEREQVAAVRSFEDGIRRREAELDAGLADRTEEVEQLLAAAKSVYAEAEEYARGCRDEAEAQGAELVAQAGVQAERIERETQRTLREADGRREELTAHMEHVRSSLAAMGARLPDGEQADGGGTVPGPSPNADD